MEPLWWGLLSIAIMSVAYEPVRLALFELGDEVGGVGGVGGLTNQFSSNDSDNSGTMSNSTVPYYFHSGFLGFTTFGGIVLLLCMLPLTLSAMVACCVAQRKGEGNNTHTEDMMHDRQVKKIFFFIGGSASIIWFVVPFAYFASSSFYRTDIWHMILAISLAASFPLSWHMSFIAIPSAGAAALAPLLRISHSILKQCHVQMGRATLFWAIFHAGGELIYLSSQNMISLLLYNSSTANKSDNLLFIFGFTIFLLLVLLSVHAFLRPKKYVTTTFRFIHSLLAKALLLIATAHWWPFAIFMAPAIACAATGSSLKTFNKVVYEDQSIVAAIALVTASLAALVGIACIWMLRQEWMMSNLTQYYSLPTQLFPPAAVCAGYILARICTTFIIFLITTQKCCRTKRLLDDTLLSTA